MGYDLSLLIKHYMCYSGVLAINLIAVKPSNFHKNHHEMELELNSVFG